MAPADADKQPLFVLRKPRDFWWTVQVPVPTDGDYVMAKLDVLYAALPQDEIDKMRGAGLAEGEKPPTDAEIVRRVLKGWRNLPDEHGNPVPYSEEAREQLLQTPAMRTALVMTYLAAASGLAARKNA